MKSGFRNFVGAALALLASTAAHAAADLAITAISATPASVLPGESVTFTVTLTNNASGTINGAATTLNDYNGGTGHVGMTLTSTTATSIVLGSSSVTIPSITAGSTGSVTVSFTVPASYSQAGAYLASAKLGFAPGTTATGTATLSAAVTEVVMTAFGSGYTSAPTVSFTGGGGSGAAGTAIVANGAIIAVHLTAAGSGYTSAPTVGFTGGGGSGATATAQIVGSVASIAVAGVGSGYGNTPDILISGGAGGSGAAASLSRNAATTGVGSVTITNAGGSSYTSAPTVNFTGGGGSGAAATATISGAISSVTITSGGAGYTSPTVSFVGGGGTGAAATATVTSGAITAITITSAGSGYTTAPAVQLSEAGTTAANLSAVITSSVSSITVTSAGTGYTSAPTVSFTGGGGSGATASAQLSGSAGAFTVSAGGSNYTSTPTVTVVGGGTSGAATYTSSFATSSTVVTVTGTPDFQITALNYPAGIAYKGGDVIPMSLTYRNNTSSNGSNNVPFVPSGSGGATYFRVQVILSSDPVFNTTAGTTSDDFVLTFFDVPITRNADSVNHTYSWNQLLPGNFPGSYYVLARIDSLEAITETIENDLTQNGNNIWQDVNATRIALLPTNFPTMYLASVNPTTSASGNNYSDNPSITADGRYVAFASDATDLITTGTDTNGERDIFLYDNQTSTVRRVNVSQQGAQADAGSATPAISGNGSYVAFSSEAGNLVLGDNNGFSDIFVVNTLTGAIARVSVPHLANQGTLGTQANGSSFRPAISYTGRYVVFESNATNLVSGGTTTGVTHLYLHDRDADNNGTFDETSAGGSTTVLVSQSTGGTQGNGNSLQAGISAGGGYIAFATDATNLGGTVTSGLRNIYVRDVSGATTTLVSFASGPAAANGSSRAPSINQNNGAASDGRYIAFASEASNLVAGDTNGVSDIFLWDRNSAATPAVRVSTATSGGQPLDPLAAPFTLGSFNPSISATGRYVAFASTATNLLPGDGIGAYGVLAAATVSGGAVTAIGLTNPGNNYYSSGTTPNPGGIYYTTVPTVTISGGGGSGATATAVLSGTTTGTITSITVTAGGSGYTSTPTVTVNGSFNQALHIYTMDRDVSGSGTFGTAGNLALSRNSVNRFGYESIRLIGVQSSAAADIYPVISGDGRWVAIPSDSDTTIGLGNTTTNLITADSNTKRDVFLHDRRINALPSTATLPTVTITSPGSGGSALVNSAISLTASATTTTGVIASVQFFVNGTSVGTSSIFPYTATWTPTAVGTYTLSALTTDSFGNIGVSSNLSVTINAAPSVGITAPTAGTLVSVNVARTVSASASATTPGATISSVQFYANGVSIGTDTTSPYSVSWTPATSGTYSLTAVATDSSSVQTTSAAVSVSAGTAPSVSITSPATNSTVSVNSTQTILASASSTNGTIASVQFFANGVSLGTDSVFPFTATWTPASTGLYSLTAIATDNVGNTTTSSIISVTVTGSAAPAISITSPTASSTVAFAAPTTITVTATSAVGSIASVQFFNGATSLGTVTTAPFSLAWTPTTAGAASLTAVATDSIGTTTTSAAVSVTVGSGPTVTLTAPTTGASVSVNTATTLLATASANVSGASIASVQFLANGTAVGTATSVPFSVAWTPTVDGTYSLTARATDTAGNVTTSTAASVTVGSAATAPAVSITSPAASATLGINAAITLTATTSTPVGTVTSVQYLANGTAIGTATTAPFSLSWTPSSAGAVSLTAVVTNSLGSTTTSSAVSVTVGAAPTVAVTAPANLAINSSGSLTATATANASGATIASVQFLANGVAISTDTSFPYAATFTPTATGTYSITAVATDTRGNQATSSAASVVVASANTAPTGVAITAPAASSTINVGTATTVTATATDADGAIASVQFFANGTAIGTATASPYSITWTPTLVGSYNLTATATDNLGGTTTSATVAVTVGGASAPGVSISVGTSLAIGGTRTITATPTTTGTLTITNVQFFANGTSLGTDTTFPYTLAWTPTTTGTYAITATVTDSAGNQATSSATNVTVSSTNTAPASVAITAPAASFSSGVGTAVTVTATATDADGAIASVQFFANGTSIGTVTTGSSPYSLSWTPTLAGSYALHVVATDNLGSTTSTSGSPVNGTIGAGNAPTAVSITAPAASASLPAGQPVTVTGTATPAAGFTIASLEFFVQVGSATAVSLGVDSQFPYAAAWTPTATGAYTLTAIATDSAGNRATSSSVAVNVVTPAAPTVSITSPTTGATVNIGTTTTIAATAADSDGTVQSVQFFVNGTALGTDVTSPYTATWTPTVAGSYALTAVATDNLGTTTTSATITVTASGGNAPTVAIIAPGNATTVPVNSANTITATATAASGLTIASVQFLANGVSLGTDTTFPYSAAWTPAATGSYSLTALATDSAGNQATSTATTVTVSSGASGLPVVSVVTPPTGTTVTVDQPLIIAANASDPDGTVANVEFVVNNVVVGGKASAPYFALFTPTAAGALSITAVVTDNAGNRVTSTAATVTVAAASGTAPTASLFYNEPGLSAPAVSTTAFTEVDVSLGSKLILTALGSSASGTIASAQFFVNGTSIATDNASPFYTTHTLSTLGQVAITALVTDSLGNAVFTTPVFLRSRPSTLAAASVVTLVSPQNGASYTVGENIVFNATHSFGTTVPTSVDFYLNGIQATTVISSPYQFIRSLTTAGSYDVHAVARTGTVTTLSSVATISVTSNSAPTVSLSSPATGSTTAIGTPITIDATASDTDGTIRSVQFFANGVALENDTTFPYGTVFNPTATGVYQLRALATDNAGNQTLSAVVSVTVTAGTAPTVALTAPAGGASVAVGSAVSVTATATANATGATISNVQFFANGISLGGDTTFPYGLTFTPAATGSFALTAQATDTAGNQSTSATVTVTVSSNTAPTVSLSAPANASTVGVGAATTVTATATDGDGTIQSVQFFVSYNNGAATSLGTVTTSPYSVTWTPRLASPAGVPYALTAVATDNLGATTTSSAISVTVAGGNAPTGVAVTAPAGMAVNTTAAITATATAVGGTPPSTIASVQFFANGVSLGTDTTFPYAANFTPTATGSYSITALATDTAGNQTASAASTVTVSASGSSPPTVAISAPAAGASITVNTTSQVTATATAAASGATIAGVQFFANGVALGTDTAFPYSVNFTPTATGAYTLTATAVDTLGNQATSTGVAITVAAPGGTAPTVTITSPAANSAVAVNNTQTITASATAATGVIAQVEFFANGVAVGGPDIAFPYSVSWTPIALGNYALTALATDTAGNRTTSAATNVNVVAALPTVAITFPTNGLDFAVGVSQTISAVATSPAGTVTSVQFFANGVSLNTDTTAPYTASWTPAVAGNVNLTAVVLDSAGTTVTSAVVRVTVGSPSVSVTSPTAGSTIPVNVAQTVTGTASSATSTISSVEFFANGVSIGADVTAPYSVSWAPTAAGAVNLTLVATDNVGLQTTSFPVAITVSSGSVTVGNSTLSASGISGTPATARPGDAVAFSINVINSAASTVPAGANNFPAGATANATITLTNLATGYSFALTGNFLATTAITEGGLTGSLTSTLTIPQQFSEAGAYRATVAINSVSSGFVGTSSFTVSTAVVTIAGLPDFEITGVTYPAGTSYRGGDIIPMSLTYINRSGTAGTPNVPWVASAPGNGSFYRISVILSTNPVFGDADDFGLSFFDNSAKLNADNVTQTLSWNQILPGNYAGSYYVLAKIDSLNTNAETVENDLTQNGNNIWLDVSAPRLAIQPSNFPTTYLVSSTPGSGPSGNNHSDNPVTSADGRYTVFASDSSNLVAGDSNNQRDIFLYDNQTAAIRRLNLSQQGAQANGPSNNPTITANGRYVAFESTATNLVLGDTNGFSDIFVVDTLTGAITRVSVASAGAQANSSSFRPSISSNGRFVTFESPATNLDAAASIVGVSQIFVHDRDVSGSGTLDNALNISTALVSRATGGAGAAGSANSTQARISGDGSYIAFASDATNLVVGDTNALRDIFLRDRGGLTTTRVSVATGGAQAAGGSSRTPSLSDDGRYIAFASDATNLVAGDTNGVSDVFVHDRTTTTTVRVSVSSAGAQATDPTTAAAARLGSLNPSISATGRYVAFASLANNLTPGTSAHGLQSATDSNGGLDVFVHDRDVSGSGTFDTAGNLATTMASVNKFGYQTIGVLGSQSTSSSDIYPSISGDGRWIAFPSDAENASGLSHTTTNLLTQDSNNARDVFLFDRRINAVPGAGTPPAVSITSPVTTNPYPVNSAISIVGNATATNGTVASVQFFANGTSLGIDTTFPYSATWTPTATGTFVLSALVTDSFGNLGVSPNVAITINPVSTNVPVVNITSPIAGATIVVNSTTTVNATATDPDGTIASVEFFANGVSLGVDTVFPYEAPWTPTATGTYTLTALATDNGGNQTTSAGVAVTAFARPTVAMTAPPVGSSHVVNTATTVTATASTAVVGGSIVSVQFFDNGVAFGTDTTAPFSVSWTPTTTGSHALTATATDNQGNQTTTPALTIAVISSLNGAPPVVSITNPTSGSAVGIGVATTVAATATDSDGSVTSVQFFVNGVSIGTDTTAPFTATWTPGAAGAFNVTAVATDNINNTTTSTPVSVNVSAAPTVAFTTPAAGATLPVNTPVALAATASDTDGVIASVSFSVAPVGGTSVVLGTDTVFPYAGTWTPTAAGSYTLTATAIDNLGTQSTATRNVTVTSGTAPTISITAPAAGATLTVNATATVTATASAVAPATIASVQFFANGVSLGTDATFPYSVPFTPTAEGTYSLTALATDTSGNQTNSAAITVTVAAGAVPTVAITSPAAGATIPVNSTSTITATATANTAGATIARVEFFANGTSLGTDTTFPYAAAFSPTATGSYTLTAIATDTAGNTATSAAVTVTVPTGTAPTVTLTSPTAGFTLAVNAPVNLGATATPVAPATITQVQFFANGVALGTDTSFPYSVPWTPATTGAYTIVAIATDTAGNQATSIAVTGSVSQVGPPDVNLLTPSAGSTFTVGTGVVLFATAADFNGTVTNVRFYVTPVVTGTGPVTPVLVGTATSAPYSTVWTPSAAGSFSVVAVATDNEGNEKSTGGSSVTIAAPNGTAPTVSITNPIKDAVLTTRSTVPLIAGVSSGSINSVTFYDNGALVAPAITTAPFSLLYTPATPGTHILYAVASDGSNVVVSPPVTVTANAATSPSAPSVSMTSPATGSTVQIGTSPATTVNLAADATDTDGTISQVQFFVNGVAVGVDTDFPYSVVYTPTSLGTYSVRATATDNAGNVSTSTPITFTAVTANAPTVVITAPAAGATIPANVTQQVTATATPAPGYSINSVQFFANGAAIGAPVATSPYTVNWTPPSAGLVSLTATAIAQQGTSTVAGSSSPINVTVTAAQAPTVNLVSPKAGDSLTIGTKYTFTATAAAAPGFQISSGAFIIGNVPQTSLAGPGPNFSFDFTPTVAANSVPIAFRATDTNGTGNSSTTVAVAVNFVPLAGPSVAVTAPTAGTSITVGTVTNVSATATPAPTAPAGTTVSLVEFLANGVTVGSTNTAPYSVTWLPTAGGTYSLTARATDSNGTLSTSQPINVTVTTPPATVSVTGPVAGAVLNVNTPQTITASASSTNGTITQVEFLVNGVLLSSDTTFPFSVPWTPVTPGVYALTARATDNFKTVTNSSVVVVTVAAGTVPTITLSSPPSGATIKVGAAQTLVANATAANGTIKQVEFFANNVSLGGAVTTFPYNFAWTPTAPGSYSLYAIATDTLGNQTASAAVSVTVAAVSPGAPAVSISSPASGASLPVGVAANIAVTATDADGTIRSVEFFANDISLGVDNVFPYNFAFTPNATGSYVLTAKATDNGGNFTTSAPVTINVSGGTAPSVAISSPVGGSTLGVNVPQTIKADASSVGGFIASVQFFLNGVPLATDPSFPYATPWTPGAVGTYVLTARATDNLGNITDSAPVTIVIGASAAPTVSIANPTNGSSFTVGAALTISADAVDSDGTITQVAFFVNGAPQGAVDTVSPYNVPWAPGSPGNYTITAQATDNNGNVTTSAPVTVVIGANAPPTIALTSPTAGLSYGLGNQVLIAATASDSDGSVTNVQFLVNSLVIGTVNAPPYNLSWRPTLSGNFTITAVATDNVGNVTTSAARAVTITASGAPAVTFTNPAAGASFGVGTTIPVAATTTGGNGPVAQVQFFVNGTPLGTADVTAPYSATWTPGAPGTYSLLAVATDSAGISSNSPGLSVVINANNAPTVAITNPATGVTVNGGSIVNLAASATDSDGTIATVNFLANGNAIGSATASPYIVPWTPTAAGAYTVVAQAVDNSGNVTNSTSITVNVSSNQAPTVRLSQPSNGSVVRTGTQTTIVATATDADGVIASVQFFANSVSVGAPVTAISSQGGYRINWTPQAEGIYRLTAVALDNSGAATTSGTFTVMAISQSTGGADTVFTGTYQQGLGEQGIFSLIAVRGKSATFIGYTTSAGITRTFYFPGLTLDASGGFAVFDTVGRPLIQGSTSLSGVSGTLDNGRMTFIGIDTAFFPATGTVAAGAYSGSFNDRPNSTIAAIIGYDASIYIYAGDGVQAAASGKVDTAGNFNLVANVGGRFIGKADPATGFLTGTFSGANGGAFIGATASGVSFSDGFLKNLSTRGVVGSGADMLIAGFVVGGTSPKQVLIRAVGPTLSSFGVTGALADPQLQILSGTSIVTTNDNWGGSPAIVSAAASVGAFPLPATSRDSAVIALLQPGAYTAQVSGIGGTTGVALMEIYDVDNQAPFSAQKIMNLATRGTVTPGQGLLVAGFVVSGNTSKKLLIRGVGPSLAGVGISSGFLADPVLKIVKNSDNSIVRENDNWETGNDTSSVADASQKVGAFNLAAGGKDAVILINLPPGGYSAQVSGVNNGSGIALIEVYEVP